MLSSNTYTTLCTSTGSGKTHSMQGYGGVVKDGPLGAVTEEAGVIPRMNAALFARVASEKAENSNITFLVTCSYFEIYNEIVYDLLDLDNRKNKGAGLEIREHTVLGIYVKGLQEIVVDTPQKLQALIDQVSVRF